MMAIYPVVQKLIRAAYFGTEYENFILQNGLLPAGYSVSDNE